MICRGSLRFVQAFVTCRLDYCNSLLAGIADVHLHASAVSSDRCSSLGLWSSTPRPHHSGSCKPPLATSSQEADIQDRKTGMEVPTRWSPKLFLLDLYVPVTLTEGRQQLPFVWLSEW